VDIQKQVEELENKISWLDGEMRMVISLLGGVVKKLKELENPTLKEKPKCSNTTDP